MSRTLRLNYHAGSLGEIGKDAENLGLGPIGVIAIRGKNSFDVYFHLDDSDHSIEDNLTVLLNQYPWIFEFEFSDKSPPSHCV